MDAERPDCRRVGTCALFSGRDWGYREGRLKWAGLYAPNERVIGGNVLLRGLGLVGDFARLFHQLYPGLGLFSLIKINLMLRAVGPI